MERLSEPPGLLTFVSSSDRVRASLQQLGDITYETQASDFIRFRDDGADASIGAIVRAVSAEDRNSCAEFRRGLDDADGLEVFTRRRVLQGRRQSSLSPLYEALDGFALLPSSEQVPWDSWFSAALLLACSMGGDVDTIARRFVDLSSDATSARFAVALDAMDRVQSLEQCRLVEVSTNYGVGFVETMVFRAVPGGLYRAPTLGLNQIAYHPTTNLAQLAASLADRLDGADVVTGPIGQDQLAATSFAMTTAGSYLATTGCLSFVAEIGAGDAFTVFVAELPEDADVVTLAESASTTNDQTCVHDQSRLVLFSPQPSFDDDGDVAIELEQYEEFARTVLLETSAR
jgi:hypothetical protein